MIDWQNFDDAKCADVLRHFGIPNPTLVQVTELQKMMAEAYRSGPDETDYSGS